MRFAILCVEMTQTLRMLTARVRYVTSGSFKSHRVRLNESTVTRDLQFIVLISEKTSESNHQQMS